jgi:hypothetical protein
MPRFFQKLSKYELWKPARDQLEAAGYDFDRHRILAGFVVPQSDCLARRWTPASRRPVGELQRV